MIPTKITPPEYPCRLSNIELLRCISMFMVLMMHTSFITFGFPTVQIVQAEPMAWLLHSLQYSIAIVAVNVFVLISGWFSIKTRIVGISNFIFQVAFLKISSFLLMLLIGYIALNKSSLSDLLMLSPYTGWFIKTYILLYILTPVLNTFAEHASQNVFKNVLVFYFSFVFSLGWLKDITGYIMGGYSISMFVGLYLLARYVRKFEPYWSKYSKSKDFSIYLLMTCVSLIGMYVPCFMGMPKSDALVQAFTRYSSPFVVVGAMYLLLLFSKINIGANRIINKIAKSCFAVYLLHFMWGMLPDIVLDLYSNYGMGRFYVVLYLLLVFIFFVSVSIDQIRIYIWEKYLLVKLKKYCNTRKK